MVQVVNILSNSLCKWKAITLEAILQPISSAFHVCSRCILPTRRPTRQKDVYQSGRKRVTDRERDTEMGRVKKVQLDNYRLCEGRQFTLPQRCTLPALHLVQFVWFGLVWLGTTQHFFLFIFFFYAYD